MVYCNTKHAAGLRMCILGGGGYLGQNLAQELQAIGHFVVILDMNFQSFSHIKLDPTKLLIVQGSVLDGIKLRDALNGCQACFHLAGYGMTGGASLNRQMALLINYEGTKYVISECKKSSVQRIIYSSSIAVVHNGSETYFADETMPYPKKFANPYAESKCLAEKVLLAASRQPVNSLLPEIVSQCKTENNIATCALRFRGIYGPGELRTIERTVNLCLSGLAMAKFKKSKFECRTQYSNIDNCVNALILAENSLRKPNSPALAQVYNIVDGGEAVDTFEFWEPLIKGVGAQVPHITIPFPVIYGFAFFLEIFYLLFGVEPIFTRFEVELMGINNTFSIEKARRELGYNPINNHDLGPTIQFFKQKKLQTIDYKKNGKKQNKFLKHIEHLLKIVLFNWLQSTVSEFLKKFFVTLFFIIVLGSVFWPNF